MLKRISTCILACMLAIGLCPSFALGNVSEGDPQVTSTLAASESTKPATPINVFANFLFEKPMCLDVTWGLEDCEGSGAGAIDHFNVYRDGELAAQVHQSAVIEEYDMYAWNCVIPVEHAWQYYTIEVTSVDANGVESDKSDPDVYYAISELNGISYWSVNATSDAVAIGVVTDDDGSVLVYRDEQLVGTIEDTSPWEECFLNDGAVEPGHVYGYQLVSVNAFGQRESGSTTLIVSVPQRGEAANSLRARTMDASQCDGTVSLSFEMTSDETVSVFRNGVKMGHFQGTDLASPRETIVFEDTPAGYGSFEYYLVATNGTCAGQSESYFYEKLESRPVVGKLPESLPSAPAARYQLTDDGCVVFEWEAPTAGSSIDSYYLFCERADGVEVVPWAEIKNGAFDVVGAETTRYVFMPEWGLNDDGAPIEYHFYVRAHAAGVGMGASSEVASFASAPNGEAPAFSAEAAPGAPRLAVELERAADEHDVDLAVVTWGLGDGGAVASFSLAVTYPNGVTEDCGTFFASEDAHQVVVLDQGFGTYEMTLTASNEHGAASSTCALTFDATLELAAEKTNDGVLLTWSNLADGTPIDGFEVIRKDAYSVTETIAVLDARTYSFRDTKDASAWGTTYRVVAKTAAGDRVSPAKEIPLDGANEVCSAPVLEARSSSEGILLSWTLPTQGVAERFYLQYRDVTAGQQWFACDWAYMPTGSHVRAYAYADATKAGHTIEFRIAGRNESGTGAFSNEVSARMPERLVQPVRVPGPVDTRVIEGERTLTLAWDAPAQSDVQPTYYHIKKWAGASLVAENIYIPAPATQWVDTDVVPSVSYEYLVLGCNGAGEREDYKLSDVVYGMVTGEENASDSVPAFVSALIMEKVPVASAVSADHAALIGEIEEIYLGLPTEQRRSVSPEATARLSEAIVALELLNPSEADLAAAARVEQMITDLPTIRELTILYSDDVASAHQAYKTLTATQRALVSSSSVSRLDESVAKIAQLQAAIAGDLLHPSSDIPIERGDDPMSYGPGGNHETPIVPIRPGPGKENGGDTGGNGDGDDTGHQSGDGNEGGESGSTGDGGDAGDSGEGTDPDPGEQGDPTPGPSDYPTEGTEGFAARLYFAILGRAPDSAGFAVQVNALNKGASPAEIAYNYFNSAEYFAMHETSEETVARVYQVMFGRDPDTAGATMWIGFMDSGMSVRKVVAGFSEAPEYRTYFGSLGLNANRIPVFDANADRAWDENGNLIYAGGNYRDINQGATSFACRMYTMVLGRSAEVGGLNVQSRALVNGTTCSTLAISFFTSAEFANKNLAPEEVVRIAYQAILGRSANDTERDYTGRAYWASRLKNEKGFTTTSLVMGFCESGEFKGVCSQYGLKPGA